MAHQCSDTYGEAQLTQTLIVLDPNGDFARGDLLERAHPLAHFLIEHFAR